jgi:hypothetical protein
MILKSLKRSMAAEYSRELSAKVKMGVRRIALLGFRNGGTAGYGLRRMLITSHKTPKLILGDQERKSVSTDRVILIPGPADEVKCVRDIFRLFVEERLSTQQIANKLNSKGISYLHGRPWYPHAVLRTLRHPKYCGCHVFGRTSQILKGPRIATPRESWCVIPNAFASIVSRELFDEAQRINQSRTIHKNNEQLLDALRALWVEKGRLTQQIINQANDVPSTQAIRVRFGSLRRVYQLIGYSGRQSSLRFTETRRKMAMTKNSLVQEIVKAFPGEVAIAKSDWRQRLRLRLRNQVVIAVHLCRGPWRQGDSMRWLLATNREEHCKFALVARMQENYHGFFDFHLMPCFRAVTRLLLEIDDPRLQKGIRFTKISEFLSATKEVEIFVQPARSHNHSC